MKLINKLIVLIILPVLFALLIIPINRVICSENGFNPRSQRNIAAPEHNKVSRSSAGMRRHTDNNYSLFQPNEMDQPQKNNVRQNQTNTQPPPPPPPPMLEPPPEFAPRQKPAENFFPFILDIIKWIVVALAVITAITGVIFILKKIKFKSVVKVQPQKRKRKDSAKSKSEPETISEAVSSFVKHRTRNSF